jgi:hypothetical protein
MILAWGSSLRSPTPRTVTFTNVGARQLVADHSLTINDDRTRLEPGYGLDDPRKAMAPVVAAPCVEPDAIAIPPDDQPISVVLDLMDPLRPGWHSLLWRGKARQDEHGPLN